MPTKQGDVSLLNDPVAQKLLHSTNPAKLAYVWRDGTPRVVPIWFHWTGQEIVLGTPAGAPKVKVLNNSKVALTIDSNDWPYKVLLIRGTATVETMDGVVPEYAAAAERYFGKEQGQAWAKQAAALSPRMSRIAVKCEWVAVQDFEKRFPNALEVGMEAAASH